MSAGSATPSLSATRSNPFWLDWTSLEWTVLAICVALGALNLWAPFTWDQAIFAMGGERLLHGGLLYRDYWDTKQPGIFWFYELGIRLFGLSEEGVHALELIWFTAFAALLLTSLRRWFDNRWGAAVATLLIVGFYWAVTEDWHQTQPEGLVVFPFFVSVWFANEAARRGKSAAGGSGAFPFWVIAGFANGVVGTFKLLLVVLPAICWAMALLSRWRDPRPGRLRDVLLGKAGLALGFVIPLAAMVLALQAHGVMREAWAAWVEFPKRIAPMIHGFPLKSLKESFGWFFERWSSLLAPALIGAWTGWRGKRSLLTTQMLVWIVACFPLILIQRFSGWEYHLWLFLLPLGLLAAQGLDAVARPLRELRPPNSPAERRILLALAVALVFVNPLASVFTKGAALAKDQFVRTPALRHRHLLRASRGSAYFRFENEGAFLREASARPGPIFVVGNPLVYWLSGRRQSVPRTGGILTEYYTADDWNDAVSHLDATSTPYIFIEPTESGLLQSERPRSDNFLAMLDQRYRVMRTDTYGTWFERVAPAMTAAPARP